MGIIKKGRFPEAGQAPGATAAGTPESSEENKKAKTGAASEPDLSENKMPPDEEPAAARKTKKAGQARKILKEQKPNLTL